MSENREVSEMWTEIETELARLEPASMHAVGAHYAEIRVDKHSIAVSTMTDAENVRDYVEANTSLHLSGCHPEGNGYVVTFTADRRAA